MRDPVSSAPPDNRLLNRGHSSAIESISNWVAHRTHCWFNSHYQFLNRQMLDSLSPSIHLPLPGRGNVHDARKSRNQAPSCTVFRVVSTLP